MKCKMKNIQLKFEKVLNQEASGIGIAIAIGYRLTQHSFAIYGTKAGVSLLRQDFGGQAISI